MEGEVLPSLEEAVEAVEEEASYIVVLLMRPARARNRVSMHFLSRCKKNSLKN